MIKYEIIQNAISQLKNAEDNIKRIHDSYKDEPFLLQMYEPSAVYLVNNLKNELRGFMDNEIIFVDEEEPDIWIRLKGERFKNGRAPLGVVGSFFQKLQSANQHSLAILGKVKHEGIRITKETKNLAEIDFAVAAPGSLKLGFKRPSPKKYLEKFDDFQLIDIDKYIKALEEAEEKSNLSIEGINLLARAIVAAEDEEEFEKLKLEINNMENLVKLLFYAREITPASNSPIESMEISGSKLNHSKGIIPITKHTRLKLREKANNLIKNESYIQATGIVREIDLDNYRFRIHNVTTDEKEYEQIECRVQRDEYTEEELQKILNKSIKISGILVLSEKGEVRWINIDRIDTLLDDPF